MAGAIVITGSPERCLDVRSMQAPPVCVAQDFFVKRVAPGVLALLDVRCVGVEDVVGHAVVLLSCL